MAFGGPKESKILIKKENYIYHAVQNKYRKIKNPVFILFNEINDLLHL
jgi:hypothetical protein